MNHPQKDKDSDAIGDLCDSDIDADFVLNDVDQCPYNNEGYNSCYHISNPEMHIFRTFTTFLFW